MHGLQLWVALPEGARHGPPRFEHHPQMPVVRDDGATFTVVVGEFGGLRSPAQVHTPLLGVEAVFPGPDQRRIALEPSYESAVLIMSGEARVAGVALAPGALLHLGQGRTEVEVRVSTPTRLFLLAGEPFEEPLVMWWNFVGRSHEEIVAARDDWAAGRRFGRVSGCEAAPLPAPEMPTVRLKARDRHGNTTNPA